MSDIRPPVLARKQRDLFVYSEFLEEIRDGRIEKRLIHLVIGRGRLGRHCK